MVSYLIIINCNDPVNAKILHRHRYNVVFQSYDEAKKEMAKIDYSTGKTATRAVAL